MVNKQTNKQIGSGTEVTFEMSAFQNTPRRLIYRF